MCAAHPLPQPVTQVTELAYSAEADTLLGLQRTLLASEQPGRHFRAAFLSHRMAYLAGDLKRPDRIALLEQCADLTRGQKDALSLALRSNCFGGIIGLSPVRAMTLGYRASAAMDGALALQPEPTFVVLQAAVSDLKTPGVWGGSPDRAIQRLQQLLATVSDRDPWHWLPPDACGHLALALLDADQPLRAAEVLSRGRELAPEYGWPKRIANRVSARLENAEKQ